MSSLLGKSISDLKSTIGKHGGVATPNRFAVYMSPPSMTLLNLDIQGSISAALSKNFKLSNLVNDPRDISLLCESCNMPGRLITTLDYQSIRHSQKIPNGYINEDVTFTFLLTQDYYMKKLFDKWASLVVDFKNYRANYQNDYSTDVIIQQLDKKNLPIYGVKLLRAYPVAVNGIGLDNNAENTVQKMSVTMTYDDFITEGALESGLSSAKTFLNTAKKTISVIKKVF